MGQMLEAAAITKDTPQALLAVIAQEARPELG